MVGPITVGPITVVPQNLAVKTNSRLRSTAKGEHANKDNYAVMINK